jgi:hypothetical protein
MSAFHDILHPLLDPNLMNSFRAALDRLLRFHLRFGKYVGNAPPDL